MNASKWRASASALLMIVGLFLTSSHAFAAAPQAPVAQPAAMASVHAGENGQTQNDLREYVDREITARFAQSETDVLEQAKRIEKEGDLVLSFAIAGIALITVVFVVGIALAWGEFRGIQRAKLEARRAGEAAVAATRSATEAVERATGAAANATAAAARATEAAENTTNAATNAEAAVSRIHVAETEVVNPAKARMHEIDESIKSAQKDVQGYFAIGADFDDPGVVGQPSELPPVEDVQRMEEADVVIMIAMKIGAIRKEELAPIFVKLGKYWDYIENYNRAIARFHRAMESDPKCWEAYLGLARAYCGLSARAGVSDAVKKRALEQAKEWNERAEKVYGRPEGKILVNRGWIAYGKSNFDEAIVCYEKAKTLDPELKYATATYNLAAVYAKVGRFEDALKNLKEVIARDKNWESAAIDPDFDGLKEVLTVEPSMPEPLRATPEQCAAFRALLQSGSQEKNKA